MGAEHFVLYDLDKVEIQNVGVSHYVLRDVGKPKVSSLKKHMKNINPNIKVAERFGRFINFDKPLNDTDIVILGFDNMESRLEASKAALNKNNKPFLLLDGRMGAEQYQQYTLSNPSLQDYVNTWYSDADASSEPCNAKATSYCSNMSGSFIANAVKKVLNNEPYSSEIIFDFTNFLLVQEQANVVN
jgi:hypothetical protein